MKSTNAALERIELAKWCKERELESLEKSAGATSDYFVGKATAFAEVWEHIVFDGITPSPSEYNLANAAWTDMVNEK